MDERKTVLIKPEATYLIDRDSAEKIQPETIWFETPDGDLMEIKEAINNPEVEI